MKYFFNVFMCKTGHLPTNYDSRHKLTTQTPQNLHHIIKNIVQIFLNNRTLVVICFSFLSAAVEPSCGDGVDADRCPHEQHDGENIRPLLHCAYAGSAGARQHRCGIA